MTDQHEKSRVLTLVFTDLADSTALKSERGDQAVRDLILRHRNHLTRLAVECSGRVIDWAGDGCFLTFETSTAGVLFSLRLQHAHSEDTDLPGVRIGIHLGEITESPLATGGAGVSPADARVRIEGLAVDIAARISGLAKPGQVLMSSAVYNSARQRMGVEAMGMPLLWQLHGTYALKGFDTPLEIAEAGIQGIAPLEAPKAGDKAQLVKRAKRQPTQFKQRSSRAVPLWAFVTVVLAMAGAIAYLATRPATSGPTGAVDTPIRSLAVLPFENLMGDETKEYFVDGMTDTLTAELSKIASIKVIARTSAMKFKDSEESLSEIARQLGVDGLIEGSVQQFDNEIRITAQLIDGRSEVHLWGENFEGTLAGVMKMQGEVAVAIADQIGAVLTPEEREDYASAKDVNPEAYDLYLQGRSIMQGRTEDDFRNALDVFERALLLDPEFALPHTGMADVYALLPLYNFFSFVTLGEATEKAFEHARKAVELDASLADAHVSLGWVLTQFDVDRNWAIAEREFRRAIELNPGLARARFRYGWLLISLGRNSDGVREMRLALDLNPLDPIALTNLGYALQYSGQYDEAVEAYLHAIETDPSLSAPYSQLYLLYYGLGRIDEALNFAQKVYDIAHSPYDEWNVIFFSALLKGREALLALVAEVEQGEHDARLLDGRAAFYFSVGDTVEALKHAEKNIRSGEWSAMDTRSLQRIESFKSDPAKRRRLDDDFRFWEILDKYDLPPLPPEHARYAKEQAYLRQKAAEAALAAQPKPVKRYSINLDPAYPAIPFMPLFMSTGEQTLYYMTNAGGVNRIMARPIDRSEATPIRGSDGAAGWFSVSPDGARVAYWARGSVWVLPVEGGVAEKVFDSFLTGPPPLLWLDDQNLIGTLRTLKLARVEVATGAATLLLPTDEFTVGTQIPMSINREKGLITFSIADGGSTPEKAVSYLMDLESGRISHIADKVFASLLPKGFIALRNSTGTTFSAFDVEQSALTGKRIEMDTAKFFWAAEDNHLAYVSYVPRASALRSLVWVDADGLETPTEATPMNYRRVRIFGTGLDQRIVVDTLDNGNLWTLENGASLRRFTFDNLAHFEPIWSPDGEEIFYWSGAGFSSEAHLTRKSTDLSSDPLAMPTRTSSMQIMLDSWNPDGKSIFGTNVSDIVAVRLDDGGRIETLISGGEYDYSSPEISPNGRWLAYTSNEQGMANIFVRSWPGLTVVGQISTDGGSHPVWTADGSSLYYRGSTHMMEVPIRPGESFAWDAPRELFEDIYAKDSSASPVRNYGFDSVAKRFLMQRDVASTSNAGATEIFIVENFAEEIEQRIAAMEAN